MLDIGWSEMLMIAVVAIVVIGPKDLPLALRAVGRWIGKARSLAREFQSSVDEMIADTDLQELRDTAKSIQSFDEDGLPADYSDPTGFDDGDDDDASKKSAPKAGGAIGDGDEAAKQLDAAEAVEATEAEAVDVSGDYLPPEETEADDAAPPGRTGKEA